MRAEDFWLKDSERFTSNPLKDEVNSWIVGLLFTATFIVISANILRLYIR